MSSTEDAPVPPSQLDEAVYSIARQLKYRSRGQLSFKTALDISGNMTAHMFGEIYKQIDPVKMGEDARFLQVAAHYGSMLSRSSKNVKEGTIQKLLTSYPSHECIIDKAEAEELFVSARSLSDNEKILITLLGSVASIAEPRVDPNNIVIFDTEENGEENEETGTEHTDQPKATFSKAPRSESRNSKVPQGNGVKAGTVSSREED